MFDHVETAIYSPTACFFCGTTEGPFVDVTVEGFMLATPSGPQEVEDAHVYICIGRDIDRGEGNKPERKIGCARTIGRVAGCKTPDEHDGMVAHVDAHRRRVVELEAREQQLETELAEEKAKSKLVSVDELQRMIAGTDAPTPA